MGRRLDHVVVTVPDLSEAGSDLEELGFAVTPWSDHAFGTSNRLVMLPDCYVEFVAVTRPDSLPGAGFAAFVARAIEAERFGPVMAVIGSTDIRSDHRCLQELGLPAPEPVSFARTTTLPDGREVEVAFETAFADLGDPGLGGFYCRHLTPELVWDPATLRHPNRASGLTAVGMGHGETATLAKLAGLAEVPVSNHGLDVGETRLEVGSNRLTFVGDGEGFEASVADTMIEMVTK